MSEHVEPEGPSAAGQFVAKIMDKEAKDAEARAAAPPPARRRARWLVLAALLAVLLALTAWNVGAIGRTGTAFSLVEEDASTRFAIYLIAQAVELHRDSTGALPATLAAIGADVEGITYASNGTSYTLMGLLSSGVVRYRSGDDLSAYAEAYDELVGAGQ